MNLVVFDFCETIVSIQTADRFVDFVAKHSQPRYFKLITLLEKALTKSRFYVLFSIFFSKYNLSKKINLLKIRGVSETKLKELSYRYYNEIIKSNFNKDILTLLLNIIEQKNIVYVISGGYNPYLELFCLEYKIDYLFSSKIKIKNKSVTGFLEGKDCMFEEKVKLLQEHLNTHNLNFENTIVYSDSITDMPLFNWAKEQYVISYNESQRWVNQNKFKEIIIKRHAKQN
jgi:HAD superfamily hydrolase (TIGR01490 family)